MSHSSMSHSRRRRSRTVRESEASSLAMNAQRLQLLEALLDFGVLSRDQLQRVGGYASRNTVNYALGRLYHSGYIDRRYAPPVIATPAQDHQALYLLDHKGAAVLAAQRGLNDWRDLGWVAKHNQISWWHLHHLVACNELLIAFQRASSVAHCQFSWLSERELRRPERQARVDIQLPSGQQRRLAAVADAYLMLSTPSGKQLAFFLECDRGTVDVGQRWTAKFLAYEAFLRSPAYPRCFPIGSHTVAVLTVTTNVGRLQTLKQACEAVSGAGFFLFSTFGDARAEHLLGHPIWRIAHQPDKYPLLADLARI